MAKWEKDIVWEVESIDSCEKQHKPLSQTHESIRVLLQADFTASGKWESAALLLNSYKLNPSSRTRTNPDSDSYQMLLPW